MPCHGLGRDQGGEALNYAMDWTSGPGARRGLVVFAKKAVRTAVATSPPLECLLWTCYNWGGL